MKRKRSDVLEQAEALVCEAMHRGSVEALTHAFMDAIDKHNATGVDVALACRTLRAAYASDRRGSFSATLAEFDLIGAIADPRLEANARWVRRKKAQRKKARKVKP